jgi:hypothetical protein
MIIELDDFPHWVDRVEGRFSSLETSSKRQAAEIAIQKGLRAAMDDDLSKIQVEFRAQRGLLQALADTQSEHGATLREHTMILQEHSTILREHSTQLAEVRAGVQTIIGLLTPEPGSDNHRDEASDAVSPGLPVN